MNAARAFARFLLALVRRFQADDNLVRAAALAYTSLLSLVPLLAVMFAVLKGLGTQRRLEPILLSRLSLTPETTETIIGYIDRTNVGTLGTLGAATLLFTVISVLGTIESTFNHIWRVHQGRSLWRKITDYLSVVLLTPFLLLAAVAVTSSLQVQQVLEWVRQSDYLSQALVFGLGLLPVVMNAAAIAVLYSVMPNRRPTPHAILIGAGVAGLAWHLVQLAYVRFQIGMANYNAIYGALSQVPVTMAWLYVSWVVVLVGAEIAAVVEFGGAASATENRPAWSAGVGLELLVRAARAFAAGGPGVDARRVARDLRLNSDAVTAVGTQLVERGWLAAVDGTANRYVLARDPAQIALADLGALLPAPSRDLQFDPDVAAALQLIEAAGTSGWSTQRLADVVGTTGAGGSRA